MTQTSNAIANRVNGIRRRSSRGAGLLLALLFSLCLWWLIYTAADAFILPWVQ